MYEFPAGTLEVNEDPQACAHRELAEEAGVAATHWISLGELFPAPGFCTEKQHLYFASGLSPHRLQGDEDEIIEPLEFSVREVEELIASGNMRDGKSIAAFAIAKLNPEVQVLL